MQTDPKKPADDQPSDPAAPDPIGVTIADDDQPAETIEEEGEPFDDNFA